MAPMIFAKAAFENQLIKVFNHGVQKRDFTHVNDIVNSILSLSECFNKKIDTAEIVNIGNGAPTNLLDFINIIEVKTGMKLQKEFIDAQLGDVAETFADDTKLNTLIGIRPKTDLNKGIDEFINWYKLYYENFNN